MPGSQERQPLGNLPRSDPRPSPSVPAPAPRPRPTGWRRYLEDNTNTKGSQVQRLYRGIRPARGGRQENDPYSYLGTFRIRCGGTRHVAVVHSAVVLQQSPWLRDEVERRDDPAAPVRTPDSIRWWQVAWALEYMYEGRVPGFEVMTGEAISAEFQERPSRPIGWGLLELWDAADFFGLRGLKARAEQAFRAYFSQGIRQSISISRRPMPPRPGEGRAEAARRIDGTDERLISEFSLTAWKIFDNYQFEYIDALNTDDACGWSFSRLAAQDEYDGLLAWESIMFDKEGAPDDEEITLEDSPQSPLAFEPVMIDLCMRFAQSGLFELGWFRALIPEGPERLKSSLEDRVRDLDFRWSHVRSIPRRPPLSRANSWRLIASNARPVPPRDEE